MSELTKRLDEFVASLPGFDPEDDSPVWRDYCQEMIYHRWRAGRIREDLSSAQILRDTWLRLIGEENRSHNETLQYRLEKTSREILMLESFLAETKHLEEIAEWHMKKSYEDDV